MFYAIHFALSGIEVADDDKVTLYNGQALIDSLIKRMLFGLTPWLGC